MHIFRTHNCGQLRSNDVNRQVKLSGWVSRKRDHGNLLFIDLRDHYGITQCVIDCSDDKFPIAESVKLESVVTIMGDVISRPDDTLNESLPTGQIEVKIVDIVVDNNCELLPFQVNTNSAVGEEIRLKYRFLDLRRDHLQRNIILRSQVIAHIRREMTEQGFLEIQTPILTASSPEGARDFLVPSRLHPGKFYALPQAPQQFKQLLMASGFDKYFQIAPCFRDEDSRADRCPGEFYQLDYEMAFCDQDDVFGAIEPILHSVFTKFSTTNKQVDAPPFKRISYHDAMNKYGSDKPDLRNPIEICDVSEIFKDSEFSIFAKAVAAGSIVKGIPAPSSASQPRSFFDKMNQWAREQGAPGLGYITFAENGEAKGPIAKLLDNDRLSQLKAHCSNGDSLFFACGKPKEAMELAGLARIKLGQDLNLIEENTVRFCWIVDFPMFEYDEQAKKIDFSHNPFSMPQGGMEALENMDPLEIKAYQYDIVCNGIELSSGAIRNHKPEVMKKAFAIAGYTVADLEEKFGGMINAFRYGAPPHGGCAPGIDRMIMLLTDSPNLREVIAFPMNQQAQDLMMGAPGSVSDQQLKELNIRVALPPVKKAV